jgi:cytosine/adenosine deaminase-related metal-dependent hydrolase
MRIQSQFLIVDCQRVLANAQIEVRDGRIIALHEAPQVQPDLWLHQSVLLPGLINAHTHLEFSDLANPLPRGDNFPAWIASVVQRRRDQSRGLDAAQLETMRASAIQAGLRECENFGTALLVDIVTQPWRRSWLQDPSGNHGARPGAATQVLALAEVLGLEANRLHDAAQWARQAMQPEPFWDPALPLIGTGVSPHATYSVLPQVCEELSQFPNELPMAMHVAESLEELQWVEQACGPFREFFKSIGLPLDQPRMQISEAIEFLASRPRSLLIHGNYLSPDELDAIARTSIAMVYCPRTHLHFQHRRYPLPEAVQRGIPLLIGTDSRASNPDLNVWVDCKTALSLFPEWTPKAALNAITGQAARVLGVAENLGSLDEGKLAWLNVVPTPPGADPERLIELLLSKDFFECPRRLEFP